MNPHQGQFQKGQLVPGTSYRVEELIGKGGMGSVYRVEHAELGRRFVLKALHGHLASRQDLVARLKNEWRALGKLEHPNIVQVTDAGQTEQGLPYYVMENLRGATLGQLMLARKRLGAREACLLVVDILAGLHAAHETGAVHRDIKPPNIFIVEGGRAKLLDFGIAKLRDQSAKVVTAGGISIGTPRYMAPEQASGTVVDGRADIYATALVLYEMVVGKGPFSHIKDQNELVMAHIGLEPERADFVDPRVPTELADLIQRWLSKSPSSRPANAEFARRELLALAQSLPHEEPTAGEEVTVGGAYDASTMGAAAPQPEGPNVASLPALASSALSPPALSSPVQPSPAMSSAAPRSGSNDSTLESGAAEGPELQATVSVGALEKGEARKHSAHPGRPKALGWGIGAAPSGKVAERGVAALAREGDTPHPRGPSRRTSVTPPPVSSLRPGGLDPNRTTLKWIGGTAAVSFLVAFGISQWLKSGPSDSADLASHQGAESQLAAAPPDAPSAAPEDKIAPPAPETAGGMERVESKATQENRPSAQESARGPEDGSKESGASLGTESSKAGPAPSASPSSTPALQEPAKAPPAPQPAPAPRPAKRSTGPRPTSSAAKVGDQLPESGLW
jgi:serine/threonine protein kinase